MDEALIVAIASDHDLKDTSQFEAAQTVLEGLAQDVTTEEASGFNPSGISSMPDDVNEDANTTETSSQQASTSDQTSTSTNTSYSIPRLTSFDDDSEEIKILLLQGMFSELKEYEIKQTLKRANGDVQTALDELLNVQYLKSTGQEKKGIDAFFDPEGDATKKKKKNRKKGKKSPGDATPSSSSGTASPSPDDLKSMKRMFATNHAHEKANSRVQSKMRSPI